MFGPLRKANEPLLDSQIKMVLKKMDVDKMSSEEYSDLLSHLERLSAVQQKRRWNMSDQTVMVVGKLLGILTIVAYEQKHVFVSKAQTLL